MCAAGDLKTVSYLVEQGADIHAVSDSGHSALQLANRYKHPEIARYLQSKGAKQ